MNYEGSGVLVTLVSGLWLSAFALSFRGLGAALIRRCSIFSSSGGGAYWLHGILAIALGMYLFSLWVLVCAAFGFLSVAALSVCPMIGLALYFCQKKHASPRILQALKILWKEGTIVDRALFLVFASLTISTFLGAAAPETGNDALAYHLYLSKLYVQAGRLLNNIPHPRALWPGMMGMLYAAGLVFQGTILAKLFSWLTAVLAVASVPAAARFLSEDRNAVRACSFFVFFTPVLWMQSLYAYSDNAITLYSFLTLISLFIWHKRSLPLGGFVLAGLFLSALLSLKLYTLTHAIVLTALAGILVRSRGQGSSYFLKALLVMGATCFLGAGVWFVRSWVLTGNPVFPFLANLFGGNGFEQTMVGRTGVPRTLGGFMAFFWFLATDPDKFGGEPFGALFLAAAPLVPLLFSTKNLYARVAAVTAALYAVIWFCNIQLARFLMPVIPVASLFLGLLVSDWLKNKRAMIKVILAPAVAMAVLQFCLSNYYAFKMAPPAIGLVTSENYLSRRERTFAFMRAIGKRLSPDDKILSIGESRLYYAPVATALMGPLVDLQMRKQGLTFGQWLSKEKITYVLTAASDKESLPASLYLKGAHAAVVAPVPVASGRSGDPEDPFYYALWALAR